MGDESHRETHRPPESRDKTFSGDKTLNKTSLGYPFSGDPDYTSREKGETSTTGHTKSMEEKMKIITLDVETKMLASEVKGGWSTPEKMGIACLVTKEMHGDYKVYTPELKIGKSATKEEVQQQINEADLIVSFNGISFDYKVLRGHGFDISGQNYDILQEFAKGKGHRISLENLARGELGETKMMNGQDAVLIWRKALEARRNGEIGSTHYNYLKVVEYCKDDVRKTEQLFRNLIENGGSIKYYDKFREEILKTRLRVPKGISL